jgi:hypothetical protein
VLKFLKKSSGAKGLSTFTATVSSTLLMSVAAEGNGQRTAADVVSLVTAVRSPVCVGLKRKVKLKNATFRQQTELDVISM